MNEHLDICMQCGHLRTMHSADGCQCYIREEIKDIYLEYVKCPCVLDNKQGKEVKL